MAGLMVTRETRGQLAAIALMRWQLIVNSLRTLRGRLEMASRVMMALTFSVGGFAGAVGMCLGAWYFVSSGRMEFLALLLWFLFLFWQFVPVVATAFTENADSSNLLRFPLSYPAFFLIRMAYGSLDLATVLGSLWLAAMAVGIGFAAPGLFAWAAVVLLAFGVVNTLLARVIFAWIERWLARRRTREILGFVFFIFLIGFQFIGPVMNRYEGRAHPQARQLAERILPAGRALPPGLAAAAVARAGEAKPAAALGALGLLCAYGAVFFVLLHARLRAQYLGENLSEAAAPAGRVKGKRMLYRGWSLPGVSGPVAAILEKEFRYLLRSGPMLFTLVMPVVVLLIFRLTPGRAGGGDGFLLKAPDMAFPVGSAYAMLVLTNLVFNNFGPDGAGAQFFYASPVRLREVVLAKNLAAALVVAMEIALVWLGVCYLYRPPALDVTLATLAGLLFALPANMAVGNVLSMYAPKKIDLGTFGRQRASSATQFAAMGCQLGIFGIAALVVLAAHFAGRLWLAAAFFLVLAAAAFGVYAFALERAEQMALARREVILAELSRA